MRCRTEVLSIQSSIQSFQQTSRFEQFDTYSHNWDSASEIQSGDNVGTDVDGELAHVIHNQRRYIRAFNAS